VAETACRALVKIFCYENRRERKLFVVSLLSVPLDIYFMMEKQQNINKSLQILRRMYIKHCRCVCMYSVSMQKHCDLSIN
jgi:hypothetical protein